MLLYSAVRVMADSVRMDTVKVMEILVCAIRNKDVTQVLRIGDGCDIPSVMVTCFDRLVSEEQRPDSCFSFDFFSGDEKVETLDCMSNLSDLPLQDFRNACQGAGSIRLCAPRNSGPGKTMKAF